MKLLNKVPLRLRLTILTALVLTVVCVLLTLSSVFTADKIYSEPANKSSHNSPENELPDKNPLRENEASSDFTYVSITYMLIMIFLGAGSSYFIAGKALKPVSNLSHSIENINESNLFQKIEGFDTNDEISKLAVSFNNMISKLETAFSHQKQFAANAAHELKTPLASIIANIEVLQIDETPSLQEYKEVLEDTLVNAQRLSTLVYDLLKMNSELNIDKCEHFDLKAMFDDIILALSESSKAKNVRIKNSISGIMLLGDQTLLQRAFFNLVQNAVKYNRMNGEVEITAEMSEDAVIVSIKDTGIGIPVEDRENIFEAFYRIDTSRSRELGGSGLGLSIVKTIIDKHNGKIFVESELGVFSKVTVVLPIN